MKIALLLFIAAGLLLASYAALCHARLAGTHALVISDLTQSELGPKVKLSEPAREQLARRFHNAERDWFHLETLGGVASAASFAWFAFEMARERKA